LPDRGFALPRLAGLCFGRMADYPMNSGIVDVR
jgi:hypothetical protein